MELNITKYTPLKPIRVENFGKIQQELIMTVAHYNGLVITEDQTAEMKKELAKLRRFRKELNDERIRIKKEWMQPYEALEDDIKKLTAVVDEPITVIDEQLKAFDERKRKEKMNDICDFFDRCGHPDWLLLEQIMDPKWLNQTTSMKAVEDSIWTKVFEIGNDIQTINSLGSISFEAMEVYKDTLDLNRAIAEGRNLADIQRRKEEAEAQRQKEAVDFQRRQEEQKEKPKTEQMAEKTPARQWRIIRVLTDLDEMNLVLDFLEANGITWE